MQLDEAATVPPLSAIVPAETSSEPKHPLVTFGVVATVRFAGSESANAVPSSDALFAFAIVIVSRALAPRAMAFGATVIVTPGAANVPTDSVADAAAPFVPLAVLLTAPAAMVNG